MKQKIAFLFAIFGLISLSACDESSPSNCADAEKKCEQNSVYVCVKGDWKFAFACDDTKACDPLTFTCENGCEGGSQRCGHSGVEICIDGAWQTSKYCAANEICNADSYTCEMNSNVCTDGAKRCNGKAIEVCQTNTWQIETQCTGESVCNADTYSCKIVTAVCANGERKCESNLLYTCSADGHWGTGIACAAGKECLSGNTACTDVGSFVCTNGESKCEDKKHVTCVNNAWTTKTCPSACDTAKGCVECVRDADCPYSKRTCDDNKCYGCKAADNSCKDNVYKGCKADRSGFETIDCNNSAQPLYCHVEGGCVECRNANDCGLGEDCNAFYECATAGSPSTIQTCKSHLLNSASKSAYGRVLDSRSTRDASTLKATLLCGRAGEKLRDYVQLVGVHNPSCSDCGNLFEYRAKLDPLGPGTHLCIWTFSLPGEKTIACQTDGGIIDNLGAVPSSDKTLSHSIAWDHTIDFENFTIATNYDNSEKVVDDKITTNVKGAIYGAIYGSDTDFSIEGKTLVFSDKITYTTEVEITNRTSNAYIGYLSFEYKGYRNDDFGRGYQKKIEVFLDGETTPVKEITLNGEIDTVQTVIIPVFRNVKTFHIKKKAWSTVHTSPRLLIDNIRWTNKP